MPTKALKNSPFLLFWVGVLTGAVLVALVFLYRIYSTDMQASLFRSTTLTTRPTVTTTATQLNTSSLLNPTSLVTYPDPQGW